MPGLYDLEKIRPLNEGFEVIVSTCAETQHKVKACKSVLNYQRAFE
jgi:hypothetical protein